MASDLLAIASSGISAASAGLDVTAQNIANAGTAGYVRETVNQSAVATAPSNESTLGSQSGVLVNGVSRDVSTYLQAQANGTAAAAAAADTGVTNLTNVENAVEQSNLYGSITTFESSLQQLGANPTDPSLRASVLSNAQNMAQSFNLASSSLAAASQGMQSDAAGGVTQVNQIAQNLAQINQQIAADPNASTNAAALLDQRDEALQGLAKLTGFTTSYASNGTVNVQLGGASGPSLVSGITANTLSSTTAANGTLSFSLNGSAVSLSGGSLSADAQGLVSAAATSTSLDGIAASLITTANAAQAAGADLNGNTGAALFSGSGAGTIAVTMTSGSQIATAAAGSGANSEDASNLSALQTALTSTGLASNTNALLFSLSSATANATTSQTALDAIAAQAKTQLAAQTGVDLNAEAANLLQYQQAFQASGKVIQVASTLFDQLIQIQ